MSAILLVEDDAAGRELAAFNLQKAGYVVDTAASGEEALEVFDGTRHVLVITDLRMAKLSGMDVLSEVKRRAPQVPVLVITAYGSVDTAVEAMKKGAFDFVGKPFNREHLLLTVQRALERSALQEEVQRLRARSAMPRGNLIAESAGMRGLLSMADRVAESEATVLVTGETGTGKELLARRIHEHSGRSNQSFVAVNCAAVPAELLESELFGHERGAFTGAVRARKGKFRQAHGGTLFLDEIAELPKPVQSKLLRALQEREVDVVGSDRPVAVDVRLIAATNRDLGSMVQQDLFREDLLYRLAVMELRIPPLRERTEDIPPLVETFVRGFATDRELVIPDEVMQELVERTWPGNVRQLENACERLVILCPGDTLRVEDLPARDEQPTPSSMRGFEDWPELPADGLSLVDLEKRVIERVLAHKNGNVSQAAAYLRVPRHVLAYRMVKYGIRRDVAS